MERGTYPFNHRNIVWTSWNQLSHVLLLPHASRCDIYLPTLSPVRVPNSCTRLFIRHSLISFDQPLLFPRRSDAIKGGSYRADTESRTEWATLRPIVVFRFPGPCHTSRATYSILSVIHHRSINPPHFGVNVSSDYINYQ